MNATVFRDLSRMRRIEAHMSNCDHAIDAGMEEQLRADPGNALSNHAGWDFYGYVWFENERFHEEVWVYGSPQETVSAASLPELMTAVNEKYGAD